MTTQVVKKVELDNLSDHDLLITLCQLVNSMADDFKEFQQRLLVMESEKISKAEVTQILADSAKVKEELYRRVTDLEQGKTDSQITLKTVIDRHDVQLEKLTGFYNRMAAIGTIVSFLLTCAMVYFMAKGAN